MKSFTFCTLPALALLGATLGSPAWAQPVYRCGSSYSQTPCEGAVTIQAEDPRTDAQRAAAKQGLARDKALVKEIEAQHRADARQAQAVEKTARKARAEATAQAKAEAKAAAKEKAKADKLEAKKRAGGKAAAKAAAESGVLTATVRHDKKKP